MKPLLDMNEVEIKIGHRLVRAVGGNVVYYRAYSPHRVANIRVCNEDYGIDVWWTPEMVREHCISFEALGEATQDRLLIKMQCCDRVTGEAETPKRKVFG